jgi:hypothetical protein
MKNTFAKLHLQISKIDSRFIQLASLAFALAIMIVNQSPMDGSGGTR